MARGRRAVEVVLSDEEREVLQRWARRPKSSQALALRCRIVLGAAAGELNKSMAARLGCSEATASKWRRRFAERRLEGLFDEPRPGPPRAITDEMVENVVVKTLEEAPGGATHWSTRSMAAATGMSQTAISRIWRAFGLKPHLTESFKVSSDPQFIDKVRDVVGLYLNPPEAAVVLCADEKTQIQALDRTAPALPLVHANAGAIVTFNDRDFPLPSTQDYGIQVMQPDAFLLDLLDLSSAVVLDELEKQAAAYQREPMTLEALLDALRRAQAPEFADEVLHQARCST